jgi:pSer/pThr/pTyr-binding forkhead associated (FHA) protein
MTQQLGLGFETEPRSAGFWLLVVIEPFSAPITTRTLNVDGELLIGRDVDADLALAGALISRRHALVRGVEGGLEIEDVSSNGTLVDGTTLKHACLRVPHECTLYVGCVRLRLRRFRCADLDCDA